MSLLGDGPVHDSTWGWVAEHIDDYVSSGGEKGHRWRGVDTLLLTTRGRKTGKLRRSALIYGRDDGSYVLVASRGGADHHPSWYLNLSADRRVEIQVGPDVMLADARDATDGERERLWPMMTSIWPDYDGYQAKTDRKIPVVVLEPV